MSAPPPLPPKNRTSAPPPNNATQSSTFQTHSDDVFNPSFTTSGVNSTMQYSSNAPPLPPKNKVTVTTPTAPVHNQIVPPSRSTTTSPSALQPIPQATYNNVESSDVFDSPFEDPYQYNRPAAHQVSTFPSKPSPITPVPPIYTPPSQTANRPPPQQPSSIIPPIPPKNPQTNSNMYIDNKQGPSLNFNTTTSVKASTVLSATQPYQSPEMQAASKYVPSSMLDKSVPVDVKMNMNLSNPETVNVNVNGINAQVPTKTMLKMATTAASVGAASYQQSNKK